MWANREDFTSAEKPVAARAAEILRRGGCAEAQQAQSYQNQAGSEHIAAVGCHDALVDDGRHQQRNEEFQQRFQQLEQRRQHAFLSIGFQKGKQGFHAIRLLLHWNRYFIG